jgi:hypothetical protein
VVAHQKMMSGQTEQNICALIVKMMRNKMKKIWKEIKGVYPPSLWAANIGLVTIAVLVIIFV